MYWLHNGSTVPHSPSSKHYIAATLFLPKLFPAKSSPKDTARRIARISIEAKLDMEEEAYVESFRPHIMDVVHAWVSVGHVTCSVGHVTCGFTHSQGAPFSQICKMTDIMEGETRSILILSRFYCSCIRCAIIRIAWSSICR